MFSPRRFTQCQANTFSVRPSGRLRGEKDILYSQPIGSNAKFNLRLRLQYELAKHNLDGYMLDPSIPSLEPGMFVADVACGTGVWLLDLVESNPAIGAEGSDVVLDNVPPRGWWPENVTFTKLNILEPLPERYVARYDVVHAQFVSIFVPDTHIAQMMENLLRMLSTLHRFRSRHAGC